MSATPGPTRPHGTEQQFTVPVPAAPPRPYAGQPARPSPARPDVDPLIPQVGTALLWVVVGWWGFLVVRLLGHVVRLGFADTMLIHTIDRGVEETVVAAVLSVLAAVLLVSVDRGRRSPLTLTSLVVAVATVGIAVWRVLP